MVFYAGDLVLEELTVYVVAGFWIAVSEEAISDDGEEIVYDPGSVRFSSYSLSLYLCVASLDLCCSHRTDLTLFENEAFSLLLKTFAAYAV